MQRISISIFRSTSGQLLCGDAENSQKELKRLLRNERVSKRLVASITDVPRRLIVVNVSADGSKFQALLVSGTVSNLLSCHVVETLVLKMKSTPRKITVADSHV